MLCQNIGQNQDAQWLCSQGIKYITLALELYIYIIYIQSSCTTLPWAGLRPTARSDPGSKPGFQAPFPHGQNRIRYWGALFMSTHLLPTSPLSLALSVPSTISAKSLTFKTVESTWRQSIKINTELIPPAAIIWAIPVLFHPPHCCDFGNSGLLCAGTSTASSKESSRHLSTNNNNKKPASLLTLFKDLQQNQLQLWLEEGCLKTTLGVWHFFINLWCKLLQHRARRKDVSKQHLEFDTFLDTYGVTS